MNVISKGNTYHWDDTFGSDGYLVGHGLGNPDASMSHLQIHPLRRKVIRIFFKGVNEIYKDDIKGITALEKELINYLNDFSLLKPEWHCDNLL